MCVLLVRFSGRKHKQLTNHQTGLWWVRKPWCCSCGSMIEETASAATNTYINVWLPRFGTFSPFVVHLSMLWFVAHQTSPISIGNLITCMYIYIWLLYMYTVCVSFLQYYMHIFLQRMPYIDGCFSCRWTFISARDSGEACGHRTGPTGAWRCTESCIRKTFLETDAIQYENQMGYLTIKKLGNIGI